MKRRGFLKKMGFACAGGTSVLAGCKGGAKADAERIGDTSQSGAKSKRILITCAESSLAQAVAAELGKANDIRLTGPSEVRTNYKFTRSDLGHGAETSELVRGLDAIVHVAEPPPGSSEVERIDYQTRGTYNLLFAAREAGVRQVVFFSSLEVMTGYDDDLEVREGWRPLVTEKSSAFSNYLGEFTCREFARDRYLSIVVLRLGKVVRAADVAGKRFESLWVEERDVAQATSKALKLDLDTYRGNRPWRIFHIQSGSPRARFAIDSAKSKSGLNYKPRFNW